MEGKKSLLKNRFENIYRGCELVAIHLDGFSHGVLYFDENKKRRVDHYSMYAPEIKNDDDGDGRTFNSDNAIKLFAGIGHIFYQGNATEIIYMNRDEFEKKENFYRQLATQNNREVLNRAI